MSSGQRAAASVRSRLYVPRSLHLCEERASERVESTALATCVGVAGSMASVLLTKAGGGGGVAGDQTELLTGLRRATPDEATSAFLALEEASSEAESVGRGGRRGAKAPSGSAACRLTGERAAWLLLGVLLLLGALAAAATALHLLRGREIDALRRDVDALKRTLAALDAEGVRKDVEQLKTAGVGAGAARDLQELKHKVTELDLYIKLRQFEDEVYEMEEDGPEDEDEEDEDEDEDDLPEDGEDDDDVDYYPDSEEVSSATPGPEHRGRFHSQYERLLATHAPPHAPPHVPANAPPHVHAARRKPGSEPAGAALTAAEVEAAAEATATTSSGRTKREIASLLPKEPESYKGGLARRVNGSEGLSLYPGLVSGRDLFASTSAPSPALPSKMLRSGESKRAGKENRDTEAAATRRHPASGGGGSSSSISAYGGNQRAPAPNFISRQSLVMQTATPAPPKHRPHQASRAAPAHAPRLQYAEAGRTVQMTPPPLPPQNIKDQRGAVALRSGTVNTLRSKKKPLMKKNLRDGEETVEGGRPQHALRRRPVFAAHYGGDSSLVKPSHAREHYSNGRLRHPNKLFSHWKASDWVNQLNMERKFSLNEGHVSITDSGLYFVYAQIYYLNENDVNGYQVEVNNKPFLRCTVSPGYDSSHNTRSAEPKANTCFTAGALYLAPGDQVSVREVGDLRWTVFQPEKSFFGLVKLGHTSRIT